MAICIFLLSLFAMIIGGAHCEAEIMNDKELVNEIAFSECLVISGTGAGGRIPYGLDLLGHKIVTGTWTMPKEGDCIKGADGEEKRWERLEAVEPGFFEDERLRGWAFMTYETDTSKILILRANHHGMVYVNGEPRCGDVYGYDWLHLPVQLKPGLNTFLFSAARGKLAAKLVVPKSDIFFTGSDHTLPDLVVGEKIAHIGAVTIVNATNTALKNAVLKAHHGADLVTIIPIPSIPPLTMRKIPFKITAPAPEATGDYPVELGLETCVEPTVQIMDTLVVTLEIKESFEARKVTFISDIDGSVQYFAFLPAREIPDTGVAPAIVMSCHGAGVEAIGQAQSYAPKSWAHIVCPTNRRPFGFDWEDWGRWDAIETLKAAQTMLQHDSQRLYLTGHSMGGHGAWHLGVTFPDKFAAVAPSAGWISFWSYAGGVTIESPTPMQEMLMRPVSASDTLELGRNYRHQGIYILHGADDDNVPVNQAWQMVDYLESFHHKYVFHEEPDAGHWWDKREDVPGVDCVDWPPLFDYLVSFRLRHPSEVIDVEFHTASPGVSAKCHWVTIEAQQKAHVWSSVDLRLEPAAAKLSGTTKNVLRFVIDAGHLSPKTLLTVELDENSPFTTEILSGTPIWFQKNADIWQVIEDPGLSCKGSHRYGPFKEAFKNHMVFVYGTKGTDEERAWAIAKARYDAEQFLYRANGSIDVIADVDFNASEYQGRNIIVYGNRDTNTVWKQLFEGSPVTVGNGFVTVGDRIVEGSDKGCLLVRPRPGDDRALVAAVSGTGIIGMRLCDRIPYFVSGIGYADVTVFGPDILLSGSEGVNMAGFFGMDWSVETGEFVWR
ncbi:MAG: prolyl oligopeptidase family serine peptidase [bacterium]